MDVALRDVPWDQALDIILRANKLGYVVDGTDRRGSRRSTRSRPSRRNAALLAEAQAEAGQLATLTRQLSYAQGRGHRGAAEADERAVAARHRATSMRARTR